MLLKLLLLIIAQAESLFKVINLHLGIDLDANVCDQTAQKVAGKVAHIFFKILFL